MGLLACQGLLVAEEVSIASDSANQGKRIVILGDSITAGHGLDLVQAYPALLQAKFRQADLPHQVVNAGVSGDTTAGGLRRVDWALAKGADVLVIALGGNDGLRGISPAATKRNLLGIIKKARAKHPQIKILVAGMQMPDNMGADYTDAFREVFPEVARESESALLPFLLEGVGGKEELNQADRIHPNAKGQQVIAGHVWQALEPLME